MAKKARKKFTVCLGRLVREYASVTVEADNEAQVMANLDKVYERYEGEWHPDKEWGCESSDSHTLAGPAKPHAKVQVTLDEET